MRHHYVPEFLQMPWTVNSSDGKLEVFRLDLPNIPANRHRPKYTGFNFDLYALTKDEIAGMGKQAIEEQFLKVIDNNAALIRNKLENNGLKSLTLNEKMDWVWFLMSLRLRQPNIVTKLKHESSVHLRATLNKQPEEYEELAPIELHSTLEEWVENRHPGLIENFGLSFFYKLVVNQEVGNKILGMRWWLWDFSEAPYDLLLSDNPCIFTSGIDNPSCVVALPIHPRKAFMATQSATLEEIMRQQRSRDLVKRLNESSLMQSNDRVYSTNDTPRRFIEKISIQRNKKTD